MGQLYARVGGAWVPVVGGEVPPLWIDVTFQNGWANAPGWTSMQYRKLGDMLQLRGHLYNGAANQTAFTLPVGYRVPGPTQVWAGVTANVAVTFNLDGTVVPSGTGHISIFNSFSLNNA